MSSPARVKRARRATWVASVEPLPGRDRPRASVRQFIEFAVNIPEQEPQVGHAAFSIARRSSSETSSFAVAFITVMRLP